MIVLKRGEHTTYTSKQGTEYWVRNRNGRYFVCKTSNYLQEIRPTKEILNHIKLG